jgi:hypothetical protein
VPRTVRGLGETHRPRSEWDYRTMDLESVRSLERIDRDDFLRLAELAAEVEASLFERKPTGAGRYAGRLLCRALCSGTESTEPYRSRTCKFGSTWMTYGTAANRSGR